MSSCLRLDKLLATKHIVERVWRWNRCLLWDKKSGILKRDLGSLTELLPSHHLGERVDGELGLERCTTRGWSVGSRGMHCGLYLLGGLCWNIGCCSSSMAAKKSMTSFFWPFCPSEVPLAEDDAVEADAVAWFESLNVTAWED
jgi:hypothetical protein